ncbi:E2F-associated phosphoprotein-like [Lineus longissimus]|uniref:E2F-associated phosphoprotein-like n=1 Tax=Lineus longissimus TaxID=88925 RepID=UPI002B4C9D2B
MSVFCEQGDGYNLDFDSDEGVSCSSGSEDDLDVILKGTPEQKRKLQLKSEGKSSTEDESDFEKEMDMELNCTVQDLELRRGFTSVKPGSSSSGKESNTSSSQPKPPTYYEEDYFDSDDSEDENDSRAPKEKRPVVSNDDLLYDPDQDDDNQRWVDQMRRKHRPKAANKNKVKPAPQSDAVLNCPACMITLCIDCQRHALYKNQYRAMFVMNCNVNNTEVLRYPKGNPKKKNKSKKRKHDADLEEEAAPDCGLNEGEAYHPVKCGECTTEVGVMDSDEVYHFFNVLASYA